MAEQQAAEQFSIQRIYVKDISYESPNAPAIFRKEWQPAIQLDLDTRSDKLEDNTFEVVLSLTVTARIDEEVAFLCEVQQAGIFSVPSLDDPQMAHMLASFCPNILFPYAREAVSNLVNFPTVKLGTSQF
jgi:preprotein translocase subunit SecB